MPPFRPRKRVAAVGLAAGAVAAVAAPTILMTTGDGSRANGATPKPLPVSEAERFALRPELGQPFDDDRASGGKGLLIWADGAATVTIDTPLDRPVVRVRGDQCGGPPSMRVRVNGKVVASQPVSDESWATVELDAASTAPQNVVSIAFFRDRGGDGCDRNLRVDWVAPNRASAAAALARPSNNPGVTPTPDPDPLHSDAPAPTPVHAPNQGDNPNQTPTPGDNQPPGSDQPPGDDPSPATPGTPTTSSSHGLFVDPTSEAVQYARRLKTARSSDAALVDRIASQPAAVWLGEWSGDVGKAASAVMRRAAAQDDARPVFVAYAIPGRDCGSHSAGGLSTSRYLAWIDQLAGAIGNKAATVILEPDALPQIECLDQAARRERYALLRGAVSRLAAHRGTRVYLDAGHSNWTSAADMAGRLQQSGIAGAAGFALNTSNFNRTRDEIAYGRQLAAKVGGKPFVVDTSRNGNGPNGGEWCNPSGRAIGETPTLDTGIAGVDAFLWVKRPGESDGTCNGGPAAGQWWPKGAVELVRNAR